MTRRWPRSEVEVARPVVAWLEEAGWTVYQEVQPRCGGPVADIAATRGGLVAVVEAKTTLTMTVLEQSECWVRGANLCYAATPGVRGDGRWFARRICGWAGIGLLEVAESGSVEERHSARLRRRLDPRASADLRQALTEERRTYAEAGTNSGRRWTMWRATCKRVRRAVEAAPGITMRDMLASIETHYASEASARASITHWIDKGKVEGVRAEREGRAIRLYPTGAADVPR